MTTTFMYTSKEAFERVKKFLIQNQYLFEAEEHNKVFILKIKE